MLRSIRHRSTRLLLTPVLAGGVALGVLPTAGATPTPAPGTTLSSEEPAGATADPHGHGDDPHGHGDDPHGTHDEAHETHEETSAAPLDGPEVTQAPETMAAATFPVPTPPTTFRTVPETPARFVGQVSCETTAKPGTLALRSTILTTYGTQRVTTMRSCTQGGASEHKDGRALDWMLNASDPADKALADTFLAWLTGPDADGVAGGNAHRLGIQYVIWNRQAWSSYRPTWSPYSGYSPHTDHIHISLSWDGAMKRTSWWTGVRVERFDYGPCQVYIGEPAPAYSGPNYTRCPAPAPRRATAFPRLWDADPNADLIAVDRFGALLLYPGSGAGGFASRRQVGQGWGGMSAITSVGDFDEDGRRDIVARDPSGGLWLYPGDGRGGFLGKRQIGWGWNVMDTIMGIGDLNADRHVDILARRASDGVLLVYPGNGRGGFLSKRQVGQLRTFDALTAVGDWDGDTRPDIVARDRDGRLLMFPGTSSNILGVGRVIGSQWDTMSALYGSGDFSGNGNPDLLARRASDGSLWMYRGNGSGGFSSRTQVGQGWSTYRIVD